MKKKRLFILFFIFLSICLILFIYFTYKKIDFGNNINKSDINNFLNISSYDATIEVEVHSNKNINKYILKQQYFSPNIIRQEVLEPENIKGLTTTFDGTNLKIENKELNLQTIYENYNCLQGNSLNLISFIEEYKNNESAEKKETDEELILRINTNNNKYKMYKKLYINKKTRLPTKMEVLNLNQNTTFYILYKEIIINKTSKEEILA